MIFNHMRIARPVTDINKSCHMYCKGLSLNKIDSFVDHEGFSGCMIGSSEIDWHLEFTSCSTHPIKPTPSLDDLLVFYVTGNEGFKEICLNMEEAGFSKVKSFNPYWNVNGCTFEDDDGYRTVIQKVV